MILKHISISLLFVGLLLGSCSDNSNTKSIENVKESTTDTIIGVNVDDIIKRGKLIAITNNTPTSYFIYRGRPMGYQYDLLADFAKSLGVELEIKIVASIPDAIDSLKMRKADIVASGLTILGERKVDIDFTLPILKTHQILIQKKPTDFLSLHSSLLEKRLLRDVTQLAGKDVFVEEGSSYYTRIINLQDEIGDSIHIHTYSGDIDMDSVMGLVHSGEMKYVIAEEYTARFFLRYYPGLDIETPVSFNQNIAWATPKNSTTLTDTINNWIKANEHTTKWAVVYNRYFKYNKSMKSRVNSEFNMINGVISKYDHLIKQNADKIGWDWLLVAAQISVESGFNPQNKSWTGAKGLMQIMPTTAGNLHGHSNNLNNPAHNIALGVKYDGILHKYWKETITDSIQAIKFSLASYNIGKGHVFDAQRLAEKYGYDPLLWDGNVEIMIKKLSKSSYNRDSVVRYGYCRGLEAFNYVNRIFYLYDNYKNFESPPG